MSIKVLQADPGPSDYCSTIEGESELSRNGSIGSLGIGSTSNYHTEPYILPLHTGAVMRDLAVEQYPTQKELYSSNCIEDTTSNTLGTQPGCNLRPISSLYSK